MKKADLLILLLILPLIFACSSLDSVIQPSGEGGNSQTSGVDLPDNIESADWHPEISKKESVVVTLKDDKGFYIGEKSQPLDKLSAVITPLIKDKTGHNRIVYLKISKEIGYQAVVNAIKQIRRADIDRVGFVVKKTPDPDEPSALVAKFPPEGFKEEKPNPLKLVVARENDGKISLNAEVMSEEQITETLKRVFKDRLNNGVFREGTNEIEKTVFFKGSPGSKYEDVIRLIDRVKLAGAQPIGLQIDDPPDLQIDDPPE